MRDSTPAMRWNPEASSFATFAALIGENVVVGRHPKEKRRTRPAVQTSSTTARWILTFDLTDVGRGTALRKPRYSVELMR